jgi:hypothetical protein
MTVFVLVAALMAGQLLTHHASTGRGMHATQQSTSLSSQDFIAQQRYLEESTSAAGTVPYYRTIKGATWYDWITDQGATASPASIGASPAVMPMMNEQQRTLEESTTAANTVAYYRTIGGMTYYDRLAGQQGDSEC